MIDLAILVRLSWSAHLCCREAGEAAIADWRAGFRRADWAGRAARVPEFEDQRLGQIAQRLVYEHDPLLEGSGEAARLRAAIGERLHSDPGDKAPCDTLGAARQELEDIHDRGDGGAFASERSTWLDAVSNRFPFPEA